MVGTLGFSDADGERLHTISLGATPESGTATFLERLTREVERAKVELPGARSVGIADGAQGDWEFLEHHTEVQVVDFWHAAESLGAAAAVLSLRCRNDTPERWDQFWSKVDQYGFPVAA